MSRKSSHWLDRFHAGILAEKQSIATAFMIGLALWSLTRLVDSVTNIETVEYRMEFTDSIKLANGQPGKQMKVMLTNLSRETTLTFLDVSLQDPYSKTYFSTDPKDLRCVFEPPAWAGDAKCMANSDGIEFEAPMLIPGTYVSITANYTQTEDTARRPIVRIHPRDSEKIQLVRPGIRTFLVRNEDMILTGILCVSLALTVLSVAAGIRNAPESKNQRGIE